MSAYETILKRRSIRKFKQEKIERKILEKLVNAARYAPSGANIQPLKYIIVDQEEKVSQVFENVKWAGYIAPDGTPKKGEKPVAYIIILADTQLRGSGYELDAGAAAQNILITAFEEGLGTCWMGAIDRDNIRTILDIPNNYIVSTLIALGLQNEYPIVEEMNDSIKYYKDDKGTLHVPKRKLKDIIIR